MTEYGGCGGGGAHDDDPPDGSAVLQPSCLSMTARGSKPYAAVDNLLRPEKHNGTAPFHTAKWCDEAPTSWVKVTVTTGPVRLAKCVAGGLVVCCIAVPPAVAV
jgi:hypothetical protein